MTRAKAQLLILDDEERIRQLLLDFFEDYDEFSARACESAEAALEELARQPADLGIVDMHLPGMDGQHFALAAHACGLCRRFLLHTGSMDFALTPELLRIGITSADVFLKPADTAELLARARTLLGLPGDETS
ncbi:MAG: two-component system response regulator [Desulfovibrionaceae bacterium CG1_02_65_16]|nr:MAG: two-component system response regulator [Desulfovibrionaceae bacterium CG1_02_65_16]